MQAYIYTYIHNHVSHPSQVGAGTHSPCTSSDSTGESGLEGDRNAGVHYSMKVQLDQELYMTEYAAIRIVFTLRGLYTCTHSGCKDDCHRLETQPTTMTP